MRKLLLIAFGFLPLMVTATTPKDTSQLKQIGESDAKEMIEEYDGWLRGHKKTDGLIIATDELVNILERFRGRRVALVYGRTLKKQTGSRRVTILLVVLKDGKNFLTNEYYDLGTDRLCPQPPLCGIEEI